MKKKYSAYALALVFILSACISQERKYIIRPEPREESQQANVTWEIIDSQNGKTEEAIPQWAKLCLNGESRNIENMQVYRDKYIFIGENRGNNFAALRQWASAFTVEQDLSRLVAARVEKRMVSAASLYPDDEYGDFFEAFVKAAIDADYPGSAIEDRFWIKRRIQTQTADAEAETGEVIRHEERFDFLILMSIDNAMLQNRIRSIMDRINTPVLPTREQAAAINRIKQTFFERF